EITRRSGRGRPLRLARLRSTATTCSVPTPFLQASRGASPARRAHFLRPHMGRITGSGKRPRPQILSMNGRLARPHQACRCQHRRCSPTLPRPSLQPSGSTAPTRLEARILTAMQLLSLTNPYILACISIDPAHRILYSRPTPTVAKMTLLQQPSPEGLDNGLSSPTSTVEETS